MRPALINLGRRAALGLWYGVVPAALAVLTLRYLVPREAGAEASAPLRVAQGLVQAQPIMAVAVLFLAFTAVVAAWSDVLPGARSIARPAPASRVGRWRSALVLGLVGLASIGGVALGAAYRTARIVSTSMLPTILPGDHLVVERRAYGPGQAPRRGDVVVFRHQGGDGEGGALVKRVLGLPGDHVTMHGSQPVVNGEPVPGCDAGTIAYLGAERASRGRLIVEWLDGRAHLALHEVSPDDFAGYTVSPGEVFVLGDNRGVSNDSRRWQGGAGVPLSAIDGRVERVLFGEDRGGRLDGARLWTALGTDLHVPGVELAALRAGVARCLAEPPTAAE